jgi:hypothetical protein
MSPYDTEINEQVENDWRAYERHTYVKNDHSINVAGEG